MQPPPVVLVPLGAADIQRAFGRRQLVLSLNFLKSMIHIPRERPVMSAAFSHGESTSEFGCPFTLMGAANMRRAKFGSISNGPPFSFALRQRPRFSFSERALVVSTLQVRSGFDAQTRSPSNIRASSDPSSIPTTDRRPQSRRAASSVVHAMKISPEALMRSSACRSDAASNSLGGDKSSALCFPAFPSDGGPFQTNRWPARLGVELGLHKCGKEVHIRIS